jgi:hypothetical protein
VLLRVDEHPSEENNLRKSMIAAVAATAALGGTATAVAANDDASLKVSVAPQKAGTKKKPVNTSVHVVITSSNIHRTLKRLEIQMPKTLMVSGKGFSTCSYDKLGAGGPSACPKGSKAGVGTAKAYVGVDQAEPQPATFEVTAFIQSKNKINFYLHAAGLSDVVSRGTVKQTSNGPRLVVQIPERAQQPLPGLYAGLSKLDTVLGAKSGSHKLIASTGCKKHKQPFAAKLVFATNPATPAGSLTTKSAAKCR